MKKKARVLLIVCLIPAVSYAASGWVLGPYLEPKLEKVLTELFGMRVTMEKLYAHPWPGKVRARRITFKNQPEYGIEPHLDIRGLRFDIDFLDLLDKKVTIRNVFLRRPLYFIHYRQDEAKPTHTNLTTWLEHIREWNRIRKSRPGYVKPEKGWSVSIAPIHIRDGRFIYKNTDEDGKETSFVFRELNGFLEGFRWPSEDPALLEQRVELKGRFGEIFSTPFSVTGDANFSSKRISFDLEGRIRDGELGMHHTIWEGLPVEVKRGRFDLTTRAVCVLGELDAETKFEIRDLKIKVNAKGLDVIQGVSVKTWIDFLSTRDRIELQIPVHGRISDPTFEYHRAFRHAFQESLRKKTAASVEIVKEGASKLAIGAQDLMIHKPAKAVAGGFGKIVEAVPASKSGLLIPEKKPKEGEPAT